MKFLTKYNHARPVTECKGVSMTDQQYRDECDIDVILKRYKVGQPLPTTSRVGSYGDFSSFGDFQDCLEKIRRAQEDFLTLPSSLRARFGNDPTAYYEFVLNPENKEECYKLGLRVKPVEDVKPVVNPARDDAESTPSAPSVATT